MKILSKAISFITVILMTIALACNSQINTYASPNFDNINRSVANVGISLFDLNNALMKQLKQDLENVENENKDKVKFTFYDGKNNISIQNETLDLVTKSNYDLFVTILADTRENPVKDFILKAKQNNIPLILMSINPQVVEKVSKYYDKVAFLLISPQSAGTVEGQIIANLWNTKKSSIDKNRDGILQYILLKGKSNEVISDERSKFAISAINNSGIKTEELQTLYSDWSKEVSKNAIENIFLRYGGNIEAIIANSDTMAIGAIEALQKYGYNTGDESKYIPVVGIAGLPEAKELIDKGLMAGTVIQDTKEWAEAIYIIGMNLINNKKPLENTNFKLENNEIIILENPKAYTNTIDIR